MKYRIHLIGAASLLLVAAGLFAILKPEPPTGTATTESKAASSAASGNKGGGEVSTNETKKADRKRYEMRDPELVAKYGESRVNLSRQVTGNVIGLIDDLIAISGSGGLIKMKRSGTGKESDLEAIYEKLGTSAERLNLTAEQKSKAASLLAERDKRQMAALKDSVGQIKKDPTAMMTLMLASDAAARGEIDGTEYKRLQSEAETQLGHQFDLTNFGINVDPVLLDDGEFVRDFKTLLNPEQQTELESGIESLADADESADAEADESEGIPATRLEELDTVIASTKKLTDGLKGMMEGLGSLPGVGR